MTIQKKKNSPKHYIDNKKFLSVIIAYKEKVKEADAKGIERPRIPEYAGECILKIAQNLAMRHPSFSSYSYREDMISDGIQNSIKYFDNFDEKQFSNPHAYFTMVCWQANVNRIKTEQRERYILYKNFERDMIMSDNGDRIKSDAAGLLTEEMYDNIARYIENFEATETKRKAKRNEMLREKKAKSSLDLYFIDDEEEKEKTDE